MSKQILTGFDGTRQWIKVNYPNYGEDLVDIVIPESTTIIGISAFCGCTSLKSVEISRSVRWIDARAFDGCTALESIIIPDSVEEIGDSVFNNCTSLKSITLSKLIPYIGDYAFDSCASLKSIIIPDSVEEIGSKAFRKCTSLKSIKLPDSDIFIGPGAFYGCTALESINISNSMINKICTDIFSTDIFQNCQSLVDINIPLKCPETGSFIGYKKCRDNIIVKLEIPEDALRSSATTHKCRCSKAKVLGFYNLNHKKLPDTTIAYSRMDEKFIYEINKIVEPTEEFDTCRWNECAPGIHFFMTFEEAKYYCL